METRPPKYRITPIVRQRQTRQEILSNADTSGNTQRIILGSDESPYLTPHPQLTSTERQQLFYEPLMALAGGRVLSETIVWIVKDNPVQVPSNALPGAVVGIVLFVIGFGWYIKTTRNIRHIITTIATVTGLLLGVA